MNTFERYLMDKHAEDCNCHDDEMNDCFIEWMDEMDSDDTFQHAEDWRKSWGE